MGCRSGHWKHRQVPWIATAAIHGVRSERAVRGELITFRSRQVPRGTSSEYAMPFAWRAQLRYPAVLATDADHPKYDGYPHSYRATILAYEHLHAANRHGRAGTVARRS